MKKKSGAGINLVFFVLALLLMGALAGICTYAYFHESEHEAKPASAPLTLTTDATTTTTSATTTASTATTTVSATTTTATTTVRRLKYHGFNETVAADPSQAELTLTEEESGDIFHYYPNSGWTFRGFTDKAAVGLPKDKSGKTASYYANSPDVKDSKSDIGFTAEIKDGKTLKVESYGGELTELRIVSNNDKYAELSYSADVKKGTLEADMLDSSYANGIYVINGEYSVSGETCDLNIYLFVNCKSDNEKDYSFYLCTGSQSETEPASTSTTTSSETTTTTTTKAD